MWLTKPFLFFVCTYLGAYFLSFTVPERTKMEEPPITKADSVVQFAQQYIGTPYKYGGLSEKTGFDCSGFTYFVMQYFGVSVPRASYGYQNYGMVIDMDNYQKGDVILFKGSNPSESRIGHVGIIISSAGEDLQFIHSSSSKYRNGVIITNYQESKNYQQRFVGIRRVIGE